MRYDWSISLSGPLNSKVCFDGQNVSGRKFWNTFKGKVRKRTKKKQISEADIPDFRVGFFAILEENKRRMEKTSTTKTTRLESWIMSSPPKGRLTQKEKNEKDEMRVENVWRVCG